MPTPPKFNMIATICVAALLLQGCGNKVDCNGSKTKADAIEVIQSHLNNAVWYREIGAALSGTPELTNIKTVSRNDELKQAECSATYTFTYNGKPREIEVAYNLAYLQDKSETEVRVVVNSVIGGLMGIVQTEPPIKNGVEKIVDPKTGNLARTIEWKSGVQDGLEEIYNPSNNKLTNQIHFVNGTKDGAEKGWDANGSTLLIDLNWADGKASGTEKLPNATGDKLLIDLTWKDGKASGFQTVGDPSPNGVGYDEYHLKDGQYEGIHNKYAFSTFPSGSGVFLYRTENYKEGKLDGVVRDYGDGGKVVEEKRYKDGVEIPADSPVPASDPASNQNQGVQPASTQ